MSTLQILQWNVQKSKNKAMSPLLDSGSQTYDIIAIQEPWLNPFTHTTYCPRQCNYHLVFPENGRPRTCLLINKDIPRSQWTAGATPDYCWVRLTTASGTYTIHNIYSETPLSHVTQEWNSPVTEVLAGISPDEHHLIVGDFNLHHEAWGGQRVPQNHAAATHLLNIIDNKDLSLLLPRGTITRQKGLESSTLDLAISTQSVANRLLRCRVTDVLDGSDHLPIFTEVQVEERLRKQPQPRKNWKKADLESISAEAVNLQLLAGDATEEQIEEYVSYLTETVVGSIHKHVPDARPAQQAQAWWNPEVRETVQAARQAHRVFIRTQTEETWSRYLEASLAKSKIIAEAKRAYWRQCIHEAAESPEGVWKLAKWARTKSHLPPEPPNMPHLQWSQGLAENTKTKAEALSERFYPESQANLADIEDHSLPDSSVELAMSQDVDEDDIAFVLRNTKKNKAPGPDEIPNQALQALGPRFLQVMTCLTERCWQIGYYPRQLKAARTVVLRKLGKEDYSQPGSWRPIALLNTMGKIVEALAARRLSILAEQNGLLPPEQMGNRPGRSTETALQLLTEQIQTVWQSNEHVASVLSLDISGAFDTVDHQRLLQNMKEKGVPGWFCRWTRSFLQDRTTTLLIDGEETVSRRLPAGVPQGSPLSPILFLFYNSPLLDVLRQPENNIYPLGFADDVNIFTFSKSTSQNCSTLERVHETCLQWADSHGIRFAAAKYTLTHFSRRRAFDLQASVQLGAITVKPEPYVRILGVLLDTKLNFKEHTKGIHRKMESQILALTRTTASTWGAGFCEARKIFLAVIRSAISYGSSVWHKPGTSPAKAQGPAASLRKHQNEGLRRVTGAFRRTRTRQLETEAFVPPLDLWLDGKTACFQARLERTGLATQIRNSCRAIQTAVRRRGTRYTPPPRLGIDTKRDWAAAWGGGELAECETKPTARVLRNWRARYLNQIDGEALVNHLRGARGYVPRDTEPTSKVLGLHTGLCKAESSILTQMRTGNIGLSEFLYTRKVPGFESAACECGTSGENTQHVLWACPNEDEHRIQLRHQLGTRFGDTRYLLGTNTGARIGTRWMIESGRIAYYSLARRLIYTG
jgi:hypothetical protein